MAIRWWPPAAPGAPVISGITVDTITTSGAEVEWDVDQLATGYVEYGTADGGPYTDTTAVQTTPALHHTRVISGLDDDTTYYGRPVSTNAGGLSANGSQFTFTTVAIGTEPDADYPPLDTFRYIPTPSFSIPTYLQTKTDPTFGTELIRVNPSTGQAHAYSTRAAWSKDRKWMLLGQGSPKLLLNGQTFAVVDSSGIDPGGGFQWSHTNPDLGFAYGAASGSTPAAMRFYRIVNNNWTLAASRPLTGLSGTWVDARMGGGYGAQSLDDTRWAGNFKDSAGWHGVFVADIDPVAMTCTIISERRLIQDSASNVQQRFGSIHISPSGDYVYASARGPGTLYHASSLATIGLVTSTDRHHDVAQLADGTDVVVMVGRSPSGGLQSANGGVGYYRMDTGAYTHVLNGPFNGGHVSGRCYEVPGYVILSSYASGTYPGQGTVFALELATGQVRYYLHTHSVSGGSYDAEPQACPSPDMAVVSVVVTWDGGVINCVVAGVDVVP
jgi:hypothetical protein